MSGPGLTRRESHHAIHEAAFIEAEELTRLLRRAANEDDQNATSRALHLAGVLIEHWQTRTLRHAEAEEQGWYRDLARERPELRADILHLTRDHDLLRTLLAEIEQIVAAHGWVAGIVERFEAMLLINAIHSRTEEQRLLGGEGAMHASHAPDATLEAAHDRGDVLEDQAGEAGGNLPGMEDGRQSAALMSGAADLDASATDVPLAVSYPRLYRLVVARLGERGIQPGDLRLSVHRGDGHDDIHEADARLVVACGPGFTQTLELPLPAVSNHLATERALDVIANACERAVRAEYFEAMQITEPGVSGDRDGKRARFSLTVLDPPMG